ncbi:protein KRI1 homolog isoform X1 [Bactrocera neohumeralis]|uniref:protein KRI1 homolog isoform X1 n=1 Tax=Bactrocera neohumeralis TaxID=98809 RepID=UPI002164FBFD|nr:protein KRI1 homolog isoform X1 [Bactrocera neohumeralis]
MNRNLFEGSDESDGEDLQISTNKEYAKSYNSFRKKELLKKFKDRGYDVNSESSSDSESSSEEDEVVDIKFDKEFLKTLSSLKNKDPTIYDKSTQFFQSINEDNDEAEDKKNVTKDKKHKPVTLKDYERQVILDKGGIFEDEIDSEEDTPNRIPSPTFAEEERKLKEEFKNVVNKNDSEDDEANEDAFGGIFKKRNKTKDEQDKEDADYLKWLAGQKDDIEDPIKESLKPLKNYWNSNNLPQSERFLRDYILNKGYGNTKSSDIPTYDEIVGDNQPLSEDEQELEKQAEFEQKYNFRFEEPDAEFIKRYPRTIEQSVRQTDDRRKQKRQEIKERKKFEKEQKMQELEIVKEMKRKEIEDKIQKIKMVTGNEELGFKDEELEEDFDPEAHDRRMQEIFNDEYYQVDEGEEKPECPSDIEELKVEDWDNYDPNVEDGEYYNDTHCEDEDFNMDCDYDPEAAKEQLQKELIENTKKRKGRKGRKSQFMEMIKTDKPVFDPVDEKTYEEYIDEYYKLDCEDMIGDIPCRFKYTETTPNDFGLTIEEILLAKNKELNQWASLKKTIQIRPEHLEKKDQRLYKLKAKNEALKRKIFKSLYGEGSDDEGAEEDILNAQSNAESTENNPINNTEISKIENKNKRKAQAEEETNKSSSINDSNEIPDKKLKLDDPNPKADKSAKINEDAQTNSKKKRKKRKSKASNAAPETSTSAHQNSNNQSPKDNKPNPFKSSKHNQSSSTSATSSIVGESSNSAFGKTKSSNPNKPNPFKGNKNNKGRGNGQANSEQSSRFVSNKIQKKKFKPNSKKFDSSNKDSKDGVSISDDRLRAYGINPKKFHKKQKFGKPQN